MCGVDDLARGAGGYEPVYSSVVSFLGCRTRTLLGPPLTVTLFVGVLVSFFASV